MSPITLRRRRLAPEKWSLSLASWAAPLGALADDRPSPTGMFPRSVHHRSRHVIDGWAAPANEGSVLIQ